MGKSYSITIDIDDVSFVDINEDQIENIRNKLEDNIRETLNTRITYGVGDIKIVFNENSN
jgi:hypothetical protein